MELSSTGVAAPVELRRVVAELVAARAPRRQPIKPAADARDGATETAAVRDPGVGL
jgi:hypothetical protein